MLPACSQQGLVFSVGEKNFHKKYCEVCANLEVILDERIDMKHQPKKEEKR